VLLDSNIIIYAARLEHHKLRRLIAIHTPAVSVISYVEVLGFHRLTDADKQYFEDFFLVSPILRLSADVLDRATWLRQQRKISLGDSLIAATALVHDRQLVTANTDDFRWILGLRLMNPLE
jgi:toxin FitB